MRTEWDAKIELEADNGVFLFMNKCKVNLSWIINLIGGLVVYSFAGCSTLNVADIRISPPYSSDLESAKFFFENGGMTNSIALTYAVKNYYIANARLLEWSDELLRGVYTASRDDWRRVSEELRMYKSYFKRLSFELIKEGFDVTVKDELGRTALHYAVFDAELTDLLLSKKGLLNAQDMKGRTPLHCAVAWLGFNSVLNGYLLDGANVLIHAGADIQIQAFDGRTAADCLPPNLKRICVLMNELSAKAKEDNRQGSIDVDPIGETRAPIKCNKDAEIFDIVN